MSLSLLSKPCSALEAAALELLLKDTRLTKSGELGGVSCGLATGAGRVLPSSTPSAASFCSSSTWPRVPFPRGVPRGDDVPWGDEKNSDPGAEAPEVALRGANGVRGEDRELGLGAGVWSCRGDTTGRTHLFGGGDGSDSRNGSAAPLIFRSFNACRHLAGPLAAVGEVAVPALAADGEVAMPAYRGTGSSVAVSAGQAKQNGPFDCDLPVLGIYEPCEGHSESEKKRGVRSGTAMLVGGSLVRHQLHG